MVRWKASDLGIPTAPATQGGAGLERKIHFRNIIVDSQLTSVLGGKFVTGFLGKYGPCVRAFVGDATEPEVRRKRVVLIDY